MIYNGKDKNLNENTGTMPNVSGALLNWFQPMTFKVTVKTIVNFKVVETFQEISSRGVLQPFTPQQLQMKPEGQRQWKWFTIHALPGLVFNPDSVFEYLGRNYRVMATIDYRLDGYVEYHVVQDYQAGT